jgi:PEP-CTERM motif
VFHRSRLMLALALLCIATAGYAALRMKTWMPANACLLCGAPEATDAAAAPAATAVGTRGSLGTLAANSADRFTPGSLAAGPLSAPGGATGSSARFGSAPHGWQPWAVGTGTFRVLSGEGSGSSVALGGLWRLTNLSRSGSGGTATAAVATTHTTAPAKGHTATAPVTRTPRSPSSSAPAASSGASAPVTSAPALTSGDGPPASASISAGPVPTDPFHSHADPPSLPSGGGASGGSGAFDPGGPGGSGGVPKAGGGVSATPEPAALLLLGSGLLGILGVLRRRRLI